METKFDVEGALRKAVIEALEDYVAVEIPKLVSKFESELRAKASEIILKAASELKVTVKDDIGMPGLAVTVRVEV